MDGEDSCDLLGSSDEGGDEPKLKTKLAEVCTELVPSLHSQAVVEFAVMDCVPRCSRLSLSTDLHVPDATSPVSRAGDSTASTAGWQQTFSDHQVPPEFVSFNIAHMSLDSLDRVQVVSDAGNIKKLLKMAYAGNSEVSMTVHRVGGLLLLDDYDVTRHVLGGRRSQFCWLDRLFREFFFQTFEDTDWVGRISSEQHRLALAGHAAQMFTQLLQHALRDAPPPSLSAPPPAALVAVSSGVRAAPVLALSPAAQCGRQTRSSASAATGSPSSVPSAKYRRHYFSRNMLWTFQDLKMLIGTDMPILGGGTHPCVSLRLHDLSEGINVLTGLDYWLDNLMSNVPEVLMCYHLDGVLKNFSLIRTDEIPQLRGSSFRPEVVHNVAENILTFLQENATKTGHTYWLFKGEKDDFAKLYDLTSLLEARFDNFTVDDNPFTSHVAVLLYRIACNMINNKHSVDNGDRLGTLRTLLNKCLELMRGDSCLQVRANILLMLTECFVPRDHAPLSTRFVDSDGQSHSADADCERLSSSSEEEEAPPPAGAPAGSSAVSLGGGGGAQSVPTLSLTGLAARPARRVVSQSAGDLRPTAVRGSAVERVSQALCLVSQALHCVARCRHPSPEQEPRVARPFQAIPMPYRRLDDAASGEPDADAAGDCRAESAATGAGGDGGGDGSGGGGGSDVGEPLLLQKAAQLCCVLASALQTPAKSPAEQLVALRAAVTALGCVARAGPAALVPEVTAAASLIAASGTLFLVRLSLPELQQVYANWADPDQLAFLNELVGSSASFLELPVTVSCHFTESQRLLLLAEQWLRKSVKLPVCSSTGHLLRSRLGLVLNELGLIRKQHFYVSVGVNGSDVAEAGAGGSGSGSGGTDEPVENSVQTDTEATHADGLLSQCDTRECDPVVSSCNTVRLEQLFRSAEKPLLECLPLLEVGVDRCVAEWNLAQLCDSWAALRQARCCCRRAPVGGDARAPCDCGTLCWSRRAADHYRHALTQARRCGQSAMDRLHRLLPPHAPPFHQLVAERRAAVAAACCAHVTGVEQLRELLSWCDDDWPAAGCESPCQRQVCLHTGLVLSRLAAAIDRDSRCGTERRSAQLRAQCVQMYQQAAHMFWRALEPQLALNALHDILLSRETDVQASGHWRDRVRCLEQSIRLVTGRESVILRVLASSCPAAASRPPAAAAALTGVADRLLHSLVNSLKIACILVRRNCQSQRKASLLTFYSALYRHALCVAGASASATERLEQLVLHIQTAFGKT